MTHSFLGVQPIFDRERQVVAYELLFRDESGGPGSRVDGDAATSQVILNAFADIGVDRLGRDKRLFINLTAGLLAADFIETLPPERVVLEILESVQVTPEVVEAARALARRGFAIALDDFVYRADWDPLLEICQLVKIDVLGDDEEAVRAKVEALPTRNRPKLLAEKVETNIQFVQCLNMGFDLFQGFYLARPRILSGKRPPGDKLRTLQLLARLQDDALDLREVEQLIGQSVTLSYRLLKILDSASLTRGRSLHNLLEAIALVGLRAIRHWATIIALGSLDTRNRFSITRALTYAHFCQLVGERHLRQEQGALFTVGLFANLDEVLEIPLSEALAPLPLDEQVKSAILQQTGVLGQVLALAKQFESDADAWVEPPVAVESGILAGYFLESFAWAQDTQAQIESVG